MKYNHSKHITSILVGLLALATAVSCSLTSHLPVGEVLYTGVDRIGHHPSDTIDAKVNEVVATALEVAPNSALLGSAYRMSPLPVGLWMYNGLFTDKEKGLRHWMWSHFKSDPTLVSQVNPELRSRAAVAALKDEGYFDATVDYEVVPNAKDSLKAKIAYDVTYRHQSRIGKITYLPSRRPRVDSIIGHTLDQSLLHTGERFSASMLEAERERLSRVLQDSGYYYFRPEYIRFAADTTRQHNTVELRVLVSVGNDRKALTPCTIDSVHYKLDFGAGLKSQNADTLRFMTVGYNGPQMIKTRALRRALGFRRHALCTPKRLSLVKTLNARLNTFKYTTTELQVLYEANDSLDNDTTSLRLNIAATYASPWTGTTEVGCVYKDNDQMGPGITSTITRRNLWGGGEKLSTQFTGSYEWRTGHRLDGDKTLLNSYELGTRVSLAVPRLQMPRWFRPERENPVSSTYSLSVDWMRRSGLFEMIKAGGQMTYDFSLDKANTIALTPLKISYVSLVRTTPGFDAMMDRYTSLRHSFENQFVPQIQLSWTYDNAATRRQGEARQYMNVTLAEAGGLVDVAMGQFGSHRKQGERQLFFQPFSQFLKATADLRSTWTLSPKLDLATRLMAGVGYAYGNSTDMPYSEQFYIGGPNSLRGFAVRGIGPGSVGMFGALPGEYDYLNRVGDIKIEGNAELRFPIAGSFYGALFVDAGNVWRMSKSEFGGRDDNSMEDLKDESFVVTHGESIDKTFLKQLALDCGLGFRLDLEMLVLRLDVGVPLHEPNAADNNYFNCRNALLKNLGWNLAVGYPF